MLTVGRLSEVRLIGAGLCWVALLQAGAAEWAPSCRWGQAYFRCLSSLQDSSSQGHILRVEQAPPITKFKASAHLHPPAFHDRSKSTAKPCTNKLGNYNTWCCHKWEEWPGGMAKGTGMWRGEELKIRLPSSTFDTFKKIINMQYLPLYLWKNLFQ